MQQPEARPLVSIVTLNFNGRPFLKGLFDSLKRTTYPNLEILMVDNCSVDNSVEYVREHYPEVKILQNKTNLLYAGGNNQGIKAASGKYICLINNDVEVDSGFVEPVISAFESDVQIGAIQPKILNMNNRSHLEYAGACGGFIDKLGYPFLRGRILFTTEQDNGQYNDPIQIFWGSGACLFLRKEALLQTDHLDVEFGLHMEEIDLCWRLNLLGWNIFSVPGSKIWHFGGGTLDQSNPQKVYWNFRNNIFLLVKNLSWTNLIMRLPLRIMLDTVALVRDFLIGNFSSSFSVIKAYGWLLSHIPTILKKRRKVQRIRNRTDKQVFQHIYPGSIIWEYFFRGRKKFSDLKFHDKIVQ